jgi:acetyl esterase/lipase
MVPELHRYGAAADRVAELWRPSGEGVPPVVVLIHGGFWRQQYGMALMHGMAQAVASLGWAAWNIEYRRTDTGGAGGWPATLADVAAAVDALADVPGVDLRTVVTCGHSAGGHLALWSAARPVLPEGAPGRQVQVAVTGAVSLAGVVNLHEAARLGLGRHATRLLLGGDPAEQPDRYALASPFALLPLGVPQVLVHGLEDETVPPELSRGYVAAARDAGDPDVTLVEVPGLDHMAIIDPAAPSWEPIALHLTRLLHAGR